MSNQMLTEVSCPNCTHPIELAEHGRQITCPACSSLFVLQGRFCPYCSMYHAQEVPFCGRCGGALVRTCGKCGAQNWAGDEYCQQCGRVLDIFDLVLQHDSLAYRRYREEWQKKVRALKADAEDASQQRMAEFMAAEVERQAELDRHLAERQKRDYLLLAFSVLLVVAFLLLLLFYSTFSTAWIR